MSHYTARRKEIWEALHPEPTVGYGQEDGEEGAEESGTTCPTLTTPKTGRGNTQFAAETSALTGESKRNINQYRAIGDALGEDGGEEEIQVAQVAPPEFGRCCAGINLAGKTPRRAISGPAGAGLRCDWVLAHRTY